LTWTPSFSICTYLLTSLSYLVVRVFNSIWILLVTSSATSTLFYQSIVISRSFAKVANCTSFFSTNLLPSHDPLLKLPIAHPFLLAADSRSFSSYLFFFSSCFSKSCTCPLLWQRSILHFSNCFLNSCYLLIFFWAASVLILNF
jgi:hypothetical protein